MQAFLTGLSTGLGLIVAIGAQNAFVLRQGMRGEHVFAVCLACALSDAVLILVGVTSFRAVAAQMPWLDPVMRYGGAAFLAWYGVRSFLKAARGTDALATGAGGAQGLCATLATCLAFTWLNPHVYLDTVVLLGSVSTQFDAARFAFAAGAMSASFLFFFTIGYGARAVGPFLARPATWRVLDALIGLTMCGIAARLAVG